MYESPITKIVGEIQQQIIREDENNLLCQVRQSVGYFVNKEELIKALNYDRDQYQKGYHDGYQYGLADKWIYVSERLPEEYVDVICCTDVEEVFVASYLGKLDDGSECFDDNDGMMWEGDVIAWMPLPKLPNRPANSTGAESEE